MTDDAIIKLAREADPWGELGKLFEMASVTPETLKRFAELVAAEERKSTAAEMERLRTLAATAEKWRGIASAKHGDGRTVQEIQREAAEVEREACAKVCESFKGPHRANVFNLELSRCAEAIRARGAAPKGGE
ncbi:MAG: hypothetical protein IPO08_23270 [Xanthomonadales bacterium]|nr:hypothetical protein [Xanthomonadales bacterium]